MALAIEAQALRKAFPRQGRSDSDVLVLDEISFSVERGESLAIVGPSGCGKTTLINILGGFLEPDEGRLLLDGAPVLSPGPDRVVVFQNYELFAWKTALANVALGLRAKGISKAARNEAARQWLRTVNLDAFENLYPFQLSGGMKQRLALARALAVDPKFLLLDEPLSALDYQMRLVIADELLQLWENSGSTVVMVTHDVDEAIYLADRILVMTPLPGRIREIVETGLPRPRTPHLRASREYVEVKEHLLSVLGVAR